MPSTFRETGGLRNNAPMPNQLYGIRIMICIVIGTTPLRDKHEECHRGNAKRFHGPELYSASVDQPHQFLNLPNMIG